MESKSYLAITGAIALMLVCGWAYAAEETTESAATVLDEQMQQLPRLLDETRADLEKANRRISELAQKIGTMGSDMVTTSSDLYELSTQLKQVEQKSREIIAEKGVIFTPYGYIKVDMVYDDTRTSGTSVTAFVQPETAGFGSDRHFTITARETRLGVNIAGPDLGEDGTSAGKIEVDFYAPATIENKAQLMLRQAYYQATFPTWNVLVGQSWEVVSPAFPNMLNYSNLCLSGNPGYRKPMIRYQRTDKAWGETTMRTDVALVRGIGTGNAPWLRSSSVLDDEASDAGYPDVQARWGITSPTKHGRPLVLGVSGHFGREEYDPVAGAPPAITSGKGTLYSSYSGNADWSVPLCKTLDFNGEVFSGRNLDSYMAGIGQGVNLTLGKGIDSIGGWGQLCYHPSPDWLFTAGAGVDDPDNGDLSVGGRERNATYFTNAIYNINRQTRVGIEVSYQETDWKGIADGDNIRVQSSLQFNF